MKATREVFFEITLNKRERKELEKLLEGKLEVLEKATLIVKVQAKERAK